ncbi:hypothetical protein GGR56DRAFT_33906 [Xylariaceae sp. FL0804]|nr:hypothetical protein GGR56DRAFT_33906 [Xylariaceae sp. FL0804]
MALQSSCGCLPSLFFLLLPFRPVQPRSLTSHIPSQSAHPRPDLLPHLPHFINRYLPTYCHIVVPPHHHPPPQHQPPYHAYPLSHHPLFLATYNQVNLLQPWPTTSQSDQVVSVRC